MPRKRKDPNDVVQQGEIKRERKEPVEHEQSEVDATSSCFLPEPAEPSTSAAAGEKTVVGLSPKVDSSLTIAEIKPEEKGGEDEAVRKLLKKLALTVARSFYTFPVFRIVEIIAKEKYVTKHRFLDFDFDVGLINESFNVLRNDRFIYYKTETVESSEGKPQRVDKYFIKYGQLVNVIKYKLEMMRKKVESIGRQNAAKTKTYFCTSCDRAWSDKECGELFCMTTLTFRCIICNKAVKCDISSVSANRKELTAKFNEQMGPIYDMIRAVESHLL